MIERRKGSRHDKVHTLSSIVEDESQTGKNTKSNGAVAIEMGAATAVPPSGEGEQFFFEAANFLKLQRICSFNLNWIRTSLRGGYFFSSFVL